MLNEQRKIITSVPLFVKSSDIIKDYVNKFINTFVKKSLIDTAALNGTEDYKDTKVQFKRNIESVKRLLL